MEELKEEGQKIKEKLEKDIIKRKFFKKLLPLLRKIDFENVAYTYNDKKGYVDIKWDMVCRETLAICDVRTVIDNQDFTRNFYISFDSINYRLDMDDFMICITDNIKDIELILRGIIGTRLCGTKNF